MIGVAALASLIISAQPGTPRDRAMRYAADIVAVAPDTESRIVLVTIAGREANFRESVERCTKTGDKGTAFSLYQLRRWHLGGHTRQEVCASNRLATKLAYRFVQYLRAKTGSIELTFAQYVGAKSVTDRRIRERVELYERLLKEASDVVS